ncbi:immunoglobulin-binding protein, partial [Escherichia coli]|nr:immunoglobulin-binding protein [Escherichia coli]
AQAQNTLIGPIQPGEDNSFLVGYSVAGRSIDKVRNVWLIGDDSFLLDSNRTVLLGNNSGVVSSPGSVSLGHDALIADSEWGTVAGKEASLISSRQSSAIGAFSSVQDSTSSVALGHGSQVSGENNVVSVGAGPEGYGESVKGAPETRRIINVSDGINNTDAATVGQLNEQFDAAQTFLLLTNERIDETDKRLSTVHAELSRDIIAGTSAAVAYTDAAATVLQEDISEARQQAYNYTDTVKADVLDETRTHRERLGTELRKEILEGTLAAVAYTDAAATVLQEDISEARQQAYNYTDTVKADVLDETRTHRERLGTELRKEILEGTSAAVAYTDAAATVLQEDISEARQQAY